MCPVHPNFLHGDRSHPYPLHVICDHRAFLAFSCEALEERLPRPKGGAPAESCVPTAPGGCGFSITPSGRYAHSREYIVSEAKAFGWELIECRGAVIRWNAGEPVHGHLVVLRLGDEVRP